MSNNDKNETESPDIIEEIIPGKNNDYNDKSLGQNNNNNQQSFIENYNEEESAQSVIEASEESETTVERNMDEAVNEIPSYAQVSTGIQEQTAQVSTGIQEQTAQATTDIAKNYLELQKQAINSFQSVLMPYFQNVQNQLWNNQEFYKSIPQMYSRLASNYVESAIAFSRMWNDIVFTNAGHFKNSTIKPNE